MGIHINTSVVVIKIEAVDRIVLNRAKNPPSLLQRLLHPLKYRNMYNLINKGVEEGWLYKDRHLLAYDCGFSDSDLDEILIDNGLIHFDENGKSIDMAVVDDLCEMYRTCDWISVGCTESPYNNKRQADKLGYKRDGVIYCWRSDVEFDAEIATDSMHQKWKNYCLKENKGEIGRASCRERV